MKKIGVYSIALLLIIFLLAVFYARTHSLLPTANLIITPPSAYSFSTVSTETPLNTFIPLPTPTSTLDYVKLASHYLRQLPTPTAIIPDWTPTSTPENLLSRIIVRKLSRNWTPTPPPLVDFSLSDNWEHIYIQAATDIINFTNADQKLYLQYVDSWTPKERLHAIARTWLLKDDLDNDGQPEWLISLPEHIQMDACCSQYIILFEKIGDVYQPMYFDRNTGYNETIEVPVVNDLNNDGYSEMVFKKISCGSGCGQRLTIATWDGNNWTNRYINSLVTDRISYVDRDNDGRIEIVLDYMTKYKLFPSYPVREATDVYGWKDGQLVLLDEIRQPTANPDGIMLDIYSALSFGKINEALDLAQPIIDNFDKTCGKMETYIGIEAMLAYAAQNNPKGMQSVLSKIVTHCEQPNNGFTHAANVLWQAYQQVNDSMLACEAMSRFIIEENRRFLEIDTGFEFFDATVIFPGFCPIHHQ